MRQSSTANSIDLARVVVGTIGPKMAGFSIFSVFFDGRGAEKEAVAMSEEAVREEKAKGVYEALRTDDTGWELWAKLGMGLLLVQALAFGMAFLRLGQPSVYAWAIVIPMMGFLTFPFSFWGLIRSIFQPPLFRRSRMFGFLALIVVGILGNSPIFPAPVSTMTWESEHRYELPFDGEWATLAGGMEKATNHHVVSPSHRFAYSFVPVVDGKRYEGRGEALEDHYCYGRPVYAPVDGVAIQVVGGEEDHEPGSYDPSQVLGNHVVLKVDEGEYLFVAHMKRGSLKVKAGDEVARGDQIGECGNSGRSFTPHVHVHLQNKRAFPIAEGLPLRFSDYVGDGEPVAKGMPRGSEDVLERLGMLVSRQVPIRPEVERNAAAEEEAGEIVADERVSAVSDEEGAE